MSRPTLPRSKMTTSLWWIGVAVSTTILLTGNFKDGFTQLPPDTPFDATRSGHAEQWRFLREASQVVPSDATFTIRAADPDTEMSLYMMAVGLLPEALAIPRTYYGRPLAASESARFLLIYGAGPGPADDPGRTTVIVGGFVVDRTSPKP